MKPITKSVKKKVGMEMNLQEVINQLQVDSLTVENDNKYWRFDEDNQIIVKYNNEVIDPAKIKILVTEGEE